MNSTISSFQSRKEWRKGNERTVLLLSNLGQAKLFFWGGGNTVIVHTENSLQVCELFFYLCILSLKKLK